MTLRISQAHNEARLTATQQTIDAGSAHGSLSFYDGTMPATIGTAPADAPLLTITLTKPCGTVGSNKLTLAQNNSAGDLVSVSGIATWARLFDGSGNAVADGTVSDDTGTGDFKIAGTAGTQLYAGGTGLLGTTTLG